MSISRIPIALGVIGVAILVIASFATERSFMLTPDPGYVLIDLAYRGSQTGYNSAYTLYADGRLVSQYVTHQGDILASREYMVEPATLEELLEALVSAGLYESSQEQLEARMGPDRRVFRASDSSEMHLTIALDRYQPSADAKPREARVTFISQSPFSIARHYEHVPEMKCFETIAHFFRDYPATGGT